MKEVTFSLIRYDNAVAIEATKYEDDEPVLVQVYDCSQAPELRELLGDAVVDWEEMIVELETDCVIIDPGPGGTTGAETEPEPEPEPEPAE